MDSPEAATAVAAATTTTVTTTTLSNSPPVQESPFSNYISSLSPIKSVKVAHVTQGFVGLNSPSFVFTSPHIVPHCETSFLQRSLCSQIPIAETPKKDDGSKKFADRQDDSEKSVPNLSGSLISDKQRDNDVKNFIPALPGSSSGCVDEYLSGPVEPDCANSVNSVNLAMKQSNDVLQSSVSGLNNSRNGILKFDDKHGMRTKVDASQTLSGQAEEDSQKQSTFEITSAKFEEDQRVGERPSNKYLDIKSYLPVEHASTEQQSGTSGGQIVQAHEDQEENAGAILHGSVQNMVQHDPEAGQIQRGMSRRCLQFEEPQLKTTVSSSCSPNPTSIVTGSRPPASATEMENLDSYHVDLTAFSRKEQIVNVSQPLTIMFPPHHSGRSNVAVSKPSGIGLHLNSIVNALPMGHSATASTKLSNIVEKISSTTEDRMVETKASLAASSATSESFHAMESLNMLQQLEHQLTPLNKRKFNSEHTENVDEIQSSPKKKRRKTLNIDGEGCKHCNCKKTKCLKLYCDCFAAGIYCADSCACQECFNRPEYEDTVLETRQQIESRNPLAFAPKIVQRVTEFPAINVEDGNRLTSSSARHKRGCNCKKSMCLKKYCECYQANVGCSSGCRCEGCKNVHGRKEEYVMAQEVASNRAEQQLEGLVDDKQEMVASNNNFLHAELYDLHNLTPLTPSFQCSDHRRGAPKSRLISSRYVPSPESECSMLPSYTKSTRSPRRSHGNDMHPEISEETLEVGSYGQGMDYNVAEMIDQFSPRCDALADICDLTPLPNPSSMSTVSSASSKTTEWANVSQVQLCPGSGRVSSGSSLRWRSSPITPVPELDETKNQGLGSESGLCDILEDGTPEILEASTPLVTVKVNSPNKKRVSPPHRHLHQLGTSSSGALKSGRKFILRAVPSFPPLTPCIDSKAAPIKKSSNK